MSKNSTLKTLAYTSTFLCTLAGATTSFASSIVDDSPLDDGQGNQTRIGITAPTDLDGDQKAPALTTSTEEAKVADLAPQSSSWLSWIWGAATPDQTPVVEADPIGTETTPSLELSVTTEENPATNTTSGTSVEVDEEIKETPVTPAPSLAASTQPSSGWLPSWFSRAPIPQEEVDTAKAKDTTQEVTTTAEEIPADLSQSIMMVQQAATNKHVSLSAYFPESNSIGNMKIGENTVSLYEGATYCVTFKGNPLLLSAGELSARGLTFQRIAHLNFVAKGDEVVKPVVEGQLFQSTKKDILGIVVLGNRFTPISSDETYKLYDAFDEYVSGKGAKIVSHMTKNASTEFTKIEIAE